MSDPLECKSGSLWRRWDLHLHAPGTKLSNSFGDPTDEAVWDRYLDILHSSPVQVFGITDYFCCDTYFAVTSKYAAKFPDCKKVFIANVELRLSESISSDGSHPNVHVLFDNDPTVCGEERIRRFLVNLETQNIDDADAKTRCSDLNSEADFASATVSLDGVLTALRSTFGSNEPYLLAFPANNDGLRSTDSSSPRKVALADRIDKTCHLFLGNEGNRDFLLRTDRYETGEASRNRLSQEAMHIRSRTWNALAVMCRDFRLHGSKRIRRSRGYVRFAMNRIRAFTSGRCRQFCFARNKTERNFWTNSRSIRLRDMTNAMAAGLKM